MSVQPEAWLFCRVTEPPPTRWHPIQSYKKADDVVNACAQGNDDSAKYGTQIEYQVRFIDPADAKAARQMVIYMHQELAKTRSAA